MRKLAVAIHKANRLFGKQGQPYNIWHGGWIKDSGIIWECTPIHLSQSQISDLNEAFKITNSIFYEPLFTSETLNWEDPEKEQQKIFLRVASHLDSQTRRLGYRGLATQRNEREREAIFLRIRELLLGTGVLVYKSGLSWSPVRLETFQRLVIAPFADQYNILHTEGTQGNNYARPTELIITHLKAIEEVYGLEITGADDRALEFRIETKPMGENRDEFRQEVRWLAPDIGMLPEDFDEKRIVLWWD
jgi:hypothetical protein